MIATEYNNRFFQESISRLFRDLALITFFTYNLLHSYLFSIYFFNHLTISIFFSIIGICSIISIIAAVINIKFSSDINNITEKTENKSGNYTGTQSQHNNYSEIELQDNIKIINFNI